MKSEMYKEHNISIAGKGYILMETESSAGWRHADTSRYVEGTTYGNWGGTVEFRTDRAEKFASLKAATEDLQDHLSWYCGIRRGQSKAVIERVLKEEHRD